MSSYYSLSYLKTNTIFYIFYSYNISIFSLHMKKVCWISWAILKSLLIQKCPSLPIFWAPWFLTFYKGHCAFLYSSPVPTQFSSPNLLFSSSKIELTSENGQMFCPISFLSFQAQRQWLPHWFLPPFSSPSCFPTYYPLPTDFTTHLESYRCFSHLLLSLCCLLITLGSPSDSHTLWCSRGLPQVYSLWLFLLYPIWRSGWGVGYRKGEHRCPASYCQSPMGSLDENAVVS